MVHKGLKESFHAPVSGVDLALSVIHIAIEEQHCRAYRCLEFVRRSCRHEGNFQERPCWPCLSDSRNNGAFPGPSVYRSQGRNSYSAPRAARNAVSVESPAPCASTQRRPFYRCQGDQRTGKGGWPARHFPNGKAHNTARARPGGTVNVLSSGESWTANILSLAKSNDPKSGSWRA